MLYACRGSKCGGAMTPGVEYVIDAFVQARGRVHERGARGFSTALVGARGASVFAELERLAATPSPPPPTVTAPPASP